jgi:ABC-type polysaccharide/polyol phosphate export systems, permease component
VIRAIRLVQRNAVVYRRIWRGSIFVSFLQPILFLAAMGLGLGSLVDRGDSSLLEGVTFLQFLAPGLLAATCMQTASFESAFPITGKMTWHRNYDAITATPMGIGDVILGELGWMAARLSMVASAFMIVLAGFHVPRSPLALLAIPAAVLTGLAFSAPIMAFAATRKSGANFNGLFRFVITPLFLFSGVFFPISRLPLRLRMIAWLTPLFHGVELVRGLTLDRLQSPGWIVHVAYLVAMMLVGTLLSMRTFRRKLRP